MVMCTFNFYCLPGAPLHVSKMAKWILSRFSLRVGESLRLVSLGKLHTATYSSPFPGGETAVLVREPRGVLVEEQMNVMSFLLWK